LLRLCLLRLHAEQETLDLAIKLVRRESIPRANSPGGDNSTSVIDDLDEYFNKSTRLLLRESWHGLSQPAILAAIDAAESVEKASIRLNRAHMYEGARLQVCRKLQDYKARRSAARLVSVINVGEGGVIVEKQVITNINGDGNIVAVADFMSNVTNEVKSNLAQSRADEPVTKLIEQLILQLNDISHKLDRNALESMTSDVKTLSQEVALQNPRRKWFEMSLDGLKEAAEAVGEVASPILATVKKLIPLLLGAL
jgi:hypothetical protein